MACHHPGRYGLGFGDDVLDRRLLVPATEVNPMIDLRYEEQNSHPRRITEPLSLMFFIVPVIVSVIA
jgi:hypothetical protein